MAGDEEEDLREDLRGFPFESRMGADAPLGSGGRGDVGRRVEEYDDSEEGGEAEREVGKRTAGGGACSSREEEWLSSSSCGM